MRPFLDRKAPRYDFARFACDRCGTSQVATVPIAQKTVQCIACDRVHKIRSEERSDTPNKKGP